MLLLLVPAVMYLGGCSVMKSVFKTDKSRFFSPEKLIRTPATGSQINPIYSSIGPADTVQELIPNATPPREGDWEYTDTDYIIGPTDVVEVSILDLLQDGLETIVRREISSSGFIDLPLLSDRIKAEGFTQEQLKEAVRNAYSPEFLRDPTVSVTVIARRQNTFSILGAVARPSQYMILRKDMRLLEALAMAGGISQVSIPYIYVIRPAPAIRRSIDLKEKPKAAVTAPQELPELPPEAPPETVPDAVPTTTTAPQPAVQGEKTQSEIDLEKALRELGTAMPGAAPATQPAQPPTPSVVPYLTETESSPHSAEAQEVEQVNVSKARKWLYTADGKWVAVTQDAEVATQPSGQGAPPVRPAGQPPVKARSVATEDQRDPFGWAKMDKSELARIIAINLPRLRSGDQRMNIIVRDNDIINIPPHQIGEFYIMGEVRSPGTYSMVGRRVTVKMAIAAAGNLGPLAWPENSVLIRRVGDYQEQVIPIDVEAIFKGEQPDTFLKPNDIIAIGTDYRTAFYAVMRNAFRMTYGFGFLYDRNFADPYGATLNRQRFLRW